MNFGPTTYGLGLLAGILSILSPCVLPLVPVLVASALNAHRWGALALGAGLALSFSVVGIFIATFGLALGFDSEVFRTLGGGVLVVFGMVLLVPWLQQQFARATSVLSNKGNQLLARVTVGGLAGQFCVGSLLGIVWSPCVGPTLGAASTLASRGQNLGQVALLMGVFGLGAAVPLVLIGSLSRAGMMRARGSLLLAGQYGKQLLGLLILAIGILIITGADKPVERWILDHTPEWLTVFTTRF